MGQAQSYDLSENSEGDPWWPQSDSFPESSNSVNALNFENNETTTTDENAQQNVYYSRSLDSREKLELFKKHLEEKRLERHAIISAKKREMDQLRSDLEKQKNENKILSEKLKDYGITSINLNEDATSSVSFGTEMENLVKQNENLKIQLQSLLEEKQNTENILLKNKELQIEQASLQHELQVMNKQIGESEQQKEEYIKHIAALKDIIKISKQMILLREGELKELKQKVTLIENTLADREAHVMSNDLREEYERQLQNIRNLRTLYEERSRISRIELQNVKDQLIDTQQKLEIEVNKTSELEQRISELEGDVSQKYDNISNLESTLGLSKAECRGLKHEMAVINQLFAQFLLGFNSPTQDVNLDKLVQLLEENHDLLTDITIKDDTDETALPRLLLHLVNDTDKSKENANIEDLQEETIDGVKENDENASGDVDTGQNNISGNQFNSPEEIVTNLPKVWRVLTELLSHQVVQPVEIDQTCTSPTTDASNPCYKSVETPAGTRYVLSVSKTYIRLKDLIMEKKYLQKEMLKMKTLNTRLEDRLHEQESRLHVVSKELSKTWHIVGRLQRQHEQLHTHEKILCYELRQKRKMLNELKEELEYCKGKWKSAREKNKESEHECHKLRSEFASRRSMAIIESGNNSAESGYSDEQEELDSEEEDLNDPEVMQKRKELEERLCIHSCTSNPQAALDNRGNIDAQNNTDDSLSLKNADNELSVSPELNCDIREKENCANINDETPGKNASIEEAIPRPSSSNDISDAFSTCVSKTEIETSEIKECDTGKEVLSGDLISEEKVRLETAHVRFNENVEILNSSDSNNDKITQEISTSDETSTPLCRARESIIKSDDDAKKRAERFKRLEEHCQQLKQTFTNQTQRGTHLSSRLDSLHQQFGAESTPSSSSNIENEPIPSTSQEKSTEKESTPSQENQPILKSDSEREERFKRLEEQCYQLKQKYSNQTKMGTELCSKLDNIHQQFSGITKDTDNSNVAAKMAEENDVLPINVPAISEVDTAEQTDQDFETVETNKSHDGEN